MELRDENGMTEQEYLAAYTRKNYPRPYLTADLVLLAPDPLSVLLIRRGGHPCLGKWAVPGGFVNPDESAFDAALRELNEETGVDAQAFDVREIGLFSKPGRDPRGWIISNAYASIISEESVRQSGGDDASDAQWFAVSFTCAENGEYRLTLTYKDTVLNAVLAEEKTHFGRTSFRIIDSGGLAFDHAAMIASALAALRAEAKNYEAVFDFLPETFTLTAMQKVQETIMNVSVLPANFRRMVSGYVEETDEYVRGEGHRPAKLYRRKR